MKNKNTLNNVVLENNARTLDTDTKRICANITSTIEKIQRLNKKQTPSSQELMVDIKKSCKKVFKTNSVDFLWLNSLCNIFSTQEERLKTKIKLHGTLINGKCLEIDFNQEADYTDGYLPELNELNKLCNRAYKFSDTFNLLYNLLNVFLILTEVLNKKNIEKESYKSNNLFIKDIIETLKNFTFSISFKVKNPDYILYKDEITDIKKKIEETLDKLNLISDRALVAKYSTPNNLFTLFKLFDSSSVALQTYPLSANKPSLRRIE